jgi:hypothetical protein
MLLFCDEENSFVIIIIIKLSIQLRDIQINLVDSNINTFLFEAGKFILKEICSTFI